uniref:Putative rRNA methylase n=1 Tax=Magnetococcus massalia (strain MO-1) TaxID=451514 RepID=A0A1S7LD76_MAGMO|nr:Putative rRNA methylase [Candidatus Magnetococcus massalia]
MVEAGLAEDAKQALTLIMTGQVLVDDTPHTKAGEQLATHRSLRLKSGQKEHSWVSRGGEKLAHGLDHFRVDPTGKVALDVGASTGGFCDVLLQHSAQKVYAVDVGYGQLAWKLAQDERIVNLERTNCRTLSTEIIPDPIDLLVSDVSFISLTLALPAAITLMGADAIGIVLVKPQFEAPQQDVGAGGIISDPTVRQAALERVIQWLPSQGCQLLGHTPSPITGTKGNIEYLLGFSKSA